MHIYLARWSEFCCCTFIFNVAIVVSFCLCEVEDVVEILLAEPLAYGTVMNTDWLRVGTLITSRKWWSYQMRSGKVGDY